MASEVCILVGARSHPGLLLLLHYKHRFSHLVLLEKLVKLLVSHHLLTVFALQNITCLFCLIPTDLVLDKGLEELLIVPQILESGGKEGAD